jgi:hypothetical protein
MEELVRPEILKVTSYPYLDLRPAGRNRVGFELRHTSGRSEDLGLKPGQWLSSFAVENNRGPIKFGFHPENGFLVYPTEAGAKDVQDILRAGGIVTEIVPTGLS